MWIEKLSIKEVYPYTILFTSCASCLTKQATHGEKLSTFVLPSIFKPWICNDIQHVHVSCSRKHVKYQISSRLISASLLIVLTSPRSFMPSTNKSSKLGILALCTCISSLYFPGAYVVDVINQHVIQYADQPKLYTLFRNLLVRSLWKVGRIWAWASLAGSLLLLCLCSLRLVGASDDVIHDVTESSERNRDRIFIGCGCDI